MANGSEELKKAADVIADEIDEDGFAKAFERYIRKRKKAGELRPEFDISRSIDSYLGIPTARVDSNISLTIIIISTILIILGVIIIANPNGVANFILRLEGISLIVDSITNWFILYKIDKEFN